VHIVEHLSKLKNYIADLELQEQFEAEIRATGFYESFLETADAGLDLLEVSKTLSQFGNNLDAQTLLRYLHHKEKLSANAEWHPHNMDKRLPWKELKVHPDNMMLFFGPNGIAAAKPTAEGRTDKISLGRGEIDNPEDTRVIYDVYYNLHDEVGIIVERYTTRRGGLPNKRDARNPDNIADYIRERLGVKGAFSAIYISGPSKHGTERLADPDLDQELQDLEKRFSHDPEKFRREAEKSGIASRFSGKGSTAITKPGSSVERIKKTMRSIRGDLPMQLADRLLPILPNLTRQVKVKLIRDGQREKAKNLNYQDLHKKGENSDLYKLIKGNDTGNKIVDPLSREIPSDFKLKLVKDYVRDQLSFVLNDPKDIERSVEDSLFVPDSHAVTSNRAEKFLKLRAEIGREAYQGSLDKLKKHVLSKAIQGDTATLEKVVNIVRAWINKKVS
jgi:hypothetical protein